MARRLESAFCFPFFPPSLFLFVFTSFCFSFLSPFRPSFLFPFSIFVFSSSSPPSFYSILLFPVALLDLLSHSSFPYSGDDDLPIATKRNAGAGMAIFAFACNAFIHTVVEFSAIHCFPDYFIVAFESSFGGVTD